MPAGGRINFKEVFMLVIARRIGQSFAIGNDVVVTVVEIRKGVARIGIKAPKEVSILRDDAKGFHKPVPSPPTKEKS